MQFQRGVFTSRGNDAITLHTTVHLCGLDNAGTALCALIIRNVSVLKVYVGFTFGYFALCNCKHRHKHVGKI